MDDLKLIKKYYGEKMMHLCRELFPTLLETPGLLFSLMDKHFAHSRFIYKGIVDNHLEENFKNIIYSSFYNKEKEDKESVKTPQELLDEAGYILYECHTEEDIQKFKKYYAKGEELCTFHGGRLQRCHVFFAVKKNVDEIKREDFTNPDRQDEYGTSVISIQFSKGKLNTISIKNRYNHTVLNPDCTFSNNLDNIIDGLTNSFEKKYGLNTECESRSIELLGFVLANDGKYYKYNVERGNVYYCPDNIIIDYGEVKQFDKSRYIIFEYFILDMKEKCILPSVNTLIDGFTHGLQNINKIKVDTNDDPPYKIITINDDINIVLNNEGKILSYKNPHLTKIGDSFLATANELIKIDIPNVVTVEDNFLGESDKLTSIDLPNLKSAGDYFLEHGKSIKTVNTPNLEKVGGSFIANGRNIERLDLPNLKEAGSNFITNSYSLEEINMPLLEKIKDNFLVFSHIKKVDLPNLVYSGSRFMQENKYTEEVNLPKLKAIGDRFLYYANNLKTINLPEVETIGDYCLFGYPKLTELSLPKVKSIGWCFLSECNSLIKIDLPEVETIGGKFLFLNKNITSIDLPNVVELGESFLKEDISLKSFSAPKLLNIGDNSCLTNPNIHIENYNLPSHIPINNQTGARIS